MHQTAAFARQLLKDNPIASMFDMGKRHGFHGLVHLAGGHPEPNGKGGMTMTYGNLTLRRWLIICAMFEFEHGSLPKPNRRGCKSLKDLWKLGEFPAWYKHWSKPSVIATINRVVRLIEMHTTPAHSDDVAWYAKVALAGRLGELQTPIDPSQAHRFRPIEPVPIYPYDGNPDKLPYVAMLPLGIPHWVVKTGKNFRCTISLDLAVTPQNNARHAQRWLRALATGDTAFFKQQRAAGFKRHTGLIHKDPARGGLELYKYFQPHVVKDPRDWAGLFE